jgi:hypothetical protein
LNNQSNEIEVAVDILNTWHFSDTEKAMILGDVPLDIIQAVKGKNCSEELSGGVWKRAGLVAGVDAALRVLFLQEKHRLEWLSNRNRRFGECSPKDVMLSGSLDGLIDIKSYLDAARY